MLNEIIKSLCLTSMHFKSTYTSMLYFLIGFLINTGLVSIFVLRSTLLGQKYYVNNSYPSKDRWLLLLGIILWLIMLAYMYVKGNKKGLKGIA